MTTATTPKRIGKARLSVGPGLELAIELADQEVVLPLSHETAIALAHELLGRIALIDRGAAQAGLELAEIAQGGAADD